MNFLDELRRLPQELRDRPQWLLAGPNKQGELKVPHSINNAGRLCPGSHSDPSTWLDFAYAVECAQEHGHAVGYCLHEDDPFACVDLDVKNATNRPSNPEQWTSAEDLERLQAIRRSLNSYTEASQSGQGFHVWVRGKIGAGRKRDGVELYSQQRFIVCTGRHVSETPTTIEDRQAMLSNMAAQMQTPDDGGPLDDTEQTLLDAAVWADARERDPQRFDAWCRGDYEAAGKPSCSECDAALLEALMYAGATNEQAQRLLLATPLGQRAGGKLEKRNGYLLNRATRFARSECTKRRAAEAAAAEHGAAVAAALLAGPRQSPQRAAGASQTAGAQPRPGAGNAVAPALPAKPIEPFAGVSLRDLYTAPSPPPLFVVEDLAPARQVTLMPADGGTGKSILWLQAAVCIALGWPFMGKKTVRSKVVVYSAEDDVDVLRNRLARICQHMGLDDKALGELADWMLVVDATDNPCLFTEFHDREGIRAASTANLDRLEATMAEWRGDAKAPVALIVDNASDTYDANENVRQYVRGFVQGLKRLMRKFNGPCVLLAHLDKATVRGTVGKATFSGSTAWHNSVRSRLLLLPDQDNENRLVLTQEKSNFGHKSAPIHMEWSPDGVLEYRGTDKPALPPMSSDMQAQIVGLVRKHNERGLFLSAATSGPGEKVFDVLSADPDYPKTLDKKRLVAVLLRARSDGLLETRSADNPAGKRKREGWFAVGVPTSDEGGDAE